MRDFGLPSRLRAVLFEFNFSASETENNGEIIFGEGAVVGPTTGLTKSSYRHYPRKSPL